MQRQPRALAVLGVLSFIAAAAQAQYPQRREGFWVGFGLGYGSANISCDNCNKGPRVDGVTGFLKLGGTVSRHVRLGGTAHAWWHSDGIATETVSNLAAAFYYYPEARSGFFLTGGLGLSNYHVNSYPSDDGWGWGFIGGAGYDIRVGRQVSLTPVLSYAYGGVGDVNQSGVGTLATGWKQNVIDLGIGVTFH